MLYFKDSDIDIEMPPLLNLVLYILFIIFLCLHLALFSFAFI